MDFQEAPSSFRNKALTGPSLPMLSDLEQVSTSLWKGVRGWVWCMPVIPALRGRPRQEERNLLSRFQPRHLPTAVNSVERAHIKTEPESTMAQGCSHHGLCLVLTSGNFKKTIIHLRSLSWGKSDSSHKAFSMAGEQGSSGFRGLEWGRGL